ncbi:MAG TPA: P-loop NTPase fold protein, partial [Vampirovibrionales bacterium]
MMEINLRKFYQACNPSKTLSIGNPEDRPYYIDFSGVRGGKIIEELGRTITRLSPDIPTCQLFTGHIGCGKSTELLRLKSQLEEAEFHVVYFESSRDLEMADVDISDILLAIARQVTENLALSGIALTSGYFTKLFKEITEVWQAPLDIDPTADLAISIAQITSQAKESPKLRTQLRQYLEPRTSGILQSINEDILTAATQQLQGREKRGLVVIVDNLDRVDNRPLPSGRSQTEYLFVDRGEQLRKLKCHVVYTIPLSLMFSHESEALKSRLGAGVAPKVLPMVPVRSRDGEDFDEGLELLRQMVLARAFPELTPGERLDFITQVFDSADTLDRLCRISGGHVRNLL